MGARSVRSYSHALCGIYTDMGVTFTRYWCVTYDHVTIYWLPSNGADRVATGSLVEPAGEDRGEGGLSRSGVPSRGDARTRRRARGRGREHEETLRKTRGREEKLEEKRRKKRESDEVEDEGRPSSLFRGS